MRAVIRYFWQPSIFSFVFFVTLQASATITITGASGASSINIVSGSTPTIRGGLAGSCTGDDINTCDSCLQVPASTFAICNRKRVYPSLNVQITIKSTTAGTVKVAGNDGTAFKTGGSVIANGSSTMSVLWSELCGSTALNASGCNVTQSLTTGNFKIGVDKNSDGLLDTNDDTAPFTVQLIHPDPAGTLEFDTIDDCAQNDLAPTIKPSVCQFTAYPGDSKTFIEDVEAGAGFPTTTYGTITKLRILIKEGGFPSSPTDVTFDPKDLSFTQDQSTYTLTDKMITGLSNNVSYYLRVAGIDSAENEIYFTSDTAIDNVCGPGSVVTPPSPPFAGVCPFAVLPGEVLGLLTKDLNCFISTAAFGSSFDTKVVDFRTFRDRVLWPSKAGRSFIEFYYNYGPIGAQWLNENPKFKPLVRISLYPAWAIAKLSLWLQGILE